MRGGERRRRAWRSALRRAAESEQRSVRRATQHVVGLATVREGLIRIGQSGSGVTTGHGTGELVVVLVLPAGRSDGEPSGTRPSVSERERSAFAEQTERR